MNTFLNLHFCFLSWQAGVVKNNEITKVTAYKGLDLWLQKTIAISVFNTAWCSFYKSNLLLLGYHSVHCPQFLSQISHLVIAFGLKKAKKNKKVICKFEASKWVYKAKSNGIVATSIQSVLLTNMFPSGLWI